MTLLNCAICETIIYKNEKRFKECKTHYCSKQCQTEGQKKTVKIICKECGSEIEIWPNRLREFNFCSKSCVGKYSMRKNRPRNVLKRSRLEIYIEENLRLYFPYVTLKCNYLFSETRLELDFYFPDLNLGIEINGIYHYELAKGGSTTLERVQENDLLKSELCSKLGINLVPVKTIESFKNKSATANHLKTVMQIILSRIPYCVSKEMQLLLVSPPGIEPGILRLEI